MNLAYTDFWGLDFYPFANDNRPETFVPTRSAALSIARLRYALGMGMGASALFGPPGSGKSRLTRMALQEFSAAHWLVAYFPNPLATARDILAVLSPALAAALPPGASGMAELQSFLMNRLMNNQPALLAIDDVQAARGTEFLEVLRTLLNIEAGGVRALSILLVGQPGMERKLAAASGFDGQLIMRAVLDPMTPEETRLYMLARLKAAGSRQGIFTKMAAESVIRYSGGLPRQVNRLCELSLVIAYGLDEKKVTPDVVDMAAADLDMLPPGEASFFPWPHSAPAAREETEERETEEEDILASLSAVDA